MVGHENKKQAVEEGENPESRHPQYATPAGPKEPQPAQFNPDDDSRLTQPTQRRN
jgi:hypothetical protein